LAGGYCANAAVAVAAMEQTTANAMNEIRLTRTSSASLRLMSPRLP
jgi:hypothetical protein